MTDKCLLLGKDHVKYREVGYCALDDNILCAICVGSDSNAPSLMFKGKILNEDAVLALRYDHHLLLAVADSHFGFWASHELLTGLAKYGQRITDMASLYATLQVICGELLDPAENSESSLLIACTDTTNGSGFGVSFGDSSAVIANALYLRRLNVKNTTYVSPNTCFELGATMAEEFRFKLMPGDTLMLFTDGIDECHYGYPETSVTDEHLHEIVKRHPDNVQRLIQNIVEQALAGVNGQPGGQDNIAIAGMIW